MAVKTITSIAAMLAIEEDDDYECCDVIGTVLWAHMIKSNLRNPRTRIFGYVDNTVPNYNSLEFRRMFRISSDTFIVLTDYLKNCPELLLENNGGRTPISVEKQALVTLWYLGGTDSITKIADRFGISESSVILSRSRVIDAILNNLKTKLICWPENQDECIEKFERRNGFSGIIGALDGTHIPIKAPHENPQAYVNRKKFHSLQLQALCNSDMLFTDCFVGYPGSVHDSRVLKNSTLWENGSRLCGGNHVLADGGYPLRRWLLTPFRDNGHLSREQKNFNYLLSSNRVVIERSFGLLKGRFRRLHYIDTQNVKTAAEVIMSACVMHNMCILQNEDLEEFMEADNDGLDNVNDQQHLEIQENDAEGVVKRNILSRRLFRN